jgi:hypothetical protein
LRTHAVGVEFRILFVTPCYTLQNKVDEEWMVRTQVYLREEQVKAIKRIASAKGLSAAEVIRGAIDRGFLSSFSDDWDDRRQRALEIVGKFRSGKPSISTKHDQCLVKAYRD